MDFNSLDAIDSFRTGRNIFVSTTKLPKITASENHHLMMLMGGLLEEAELSPPLQRRTLPFRWHAGAMTTSFLYVKPPQHASILGESSSNTWTDPIILSRLWQQDPWGRVYMSNPNESYLIKNSLVVSILETPRTGSQAQWFIPRMIPMSQRLPKVPSWQLPGQKQTTILSVSIWCVALTHQRRVGWVSIPFSSWGCSCETAVNGVQWS